MTTEPAPAVPAEGLAVDRVLVPLDGLPEAESALDTAIAVAERFAVPLALFCWHWGIGAEWVGRRYLEEVRARRQLDCEIQPAWTDDQGAADPVLVEAHRTPATLVCMASHARSGIGALLNGSTTEALLRRGEALLLVGPDATAAPPDLDRPVMVAVDGSVLSEWAIPVASGWARRLDVPLELVTCIEPDAVAQGNAWRDDVIDAGYLEGLAARSGATLWETLHGARPAAAIVDHAAGHASLIVATTHGRSGLARVVAGSVAMRIVHHAPCPVLLMRPPESGEGWS